MADFYRTIIFGHDDIAYADILTSGIFFIVFNVHVLLIIKYTDIKVYHVKPNPNSINNTMKP